MKTKHLLFIAFFSIIVVIITVFGLISYNISSDVAINQQQEFIKRLTYEEAERIGLLLPKKQTETILDWKEWVAFHEEQKVIDIVANKQQIIASGLPADELASRFGLTPMQIASLLASSEESGHFSAHGTLYIWARAPIADSGLTLLDLHFDAKAITSSLSVLTKRLILLAGIILWFASWVVTIIATLITRYIDRQNKQLEYKTLHDELTGLANRTMMQRELQQLISTGRLQKQWLALLIADIDRFKEINNTLGHELGDQLLKEVAQRLWNSLPAGCLVARLNADEFGIMATIESIDECNRIIQKINHALQSPIRIADQSIRVDVSIGVSVYPKHSHDATALIRHAEIAMYNAKNSAGSYAFYSSTKDPHTKRKLELMNHLRNALEKREMQLHFQPRFNMNSGLYDSVETFIRWYHPTKGVIYPDEIFQLASQLGITKLLSMWTVESAVRFCAARHKEGHRLSVSINLGTSILTSEGFTENLAALLHGYELGASNIILEISEQEITYSSSQLIPVLNSLTSLGVEISVDDFGSGYTSLTFLNRLPIKEIKIDKSLISSIENEANAKLIHSIIDMSHGMSYRVVAEGVESSSVLHRLHALHCDAAQGYYLCKPLAESEFITWLNNSSKDIIKLALK